MGFCITLEPGQQTFEAQTDECILDAALRQGVLLPHGCRDGACGSCRGKVLHGTVDHGRTSPQVLSEAERAAGFALFCCATPQENLIIEASAARRPTDIPVLTLPARVEKLTLVAPDVMLVELRLPAGERFNFLPGQYIDILLKDGRRRAFSLANAPHDDARLQLHIRRIDGGYFTGQVFTTLKERDLLRIKGPQGSFFLREESTKPMLFIAGGTGFAPIKAIIEHALASGIARPMTLYWGARRSEDLYLKALAESWAGQNSDFRFIPVLSEAEAGWQGRTGLVHRAVMQDLTDLSGYQAYVCGSPAMIAAARHDLVQHGGLPAEEFLSDAFSFAADVPSASASR